ncbi:MAG: acyl carrier protein [Candidatus Wallbacteria bacterium]|nr:acyl carrier protein [Candidatus Wallbacteria bacterium]
MMNRDEIYGKVKRCLNQALGVEEERMKPDTSLTRDLEAESIDFVDIIFRMEKAFGLKIPQGELFPQEIFSNKQYVSAGKLTGEGLNVLRTRYPYIDLSDVNGDLPVSDLAKYYTVDMLVKYVEHKLSVQ